MRSTRPSRKRRAVPDDAAEQQNINLHLQNINEEAELEPRVTLRPRGGIAAPVAVRPG
jgi:hypothetical protein